MKGLPFSPDCMWLGVCDQITNKSLPSLCESNGGVSQLLAHTPRRGVRNQGAIVCQACSSAVFAFWVDSDAQCLTMWAGATGNHLGYIWGLNSGGGLNTFQWGSHQTNWCPLVTQLNPNTTVAVEGLGPFAKDWVEYKRVLPTGHRCLGPFAIYHNTVTIEAVGVVYTSLLGVKSYD